MILGSKYELAYSHRRRFDEGKIMVVRSKSAIAALLIAASSMMVAEAATAQTATEEAPTVLQAVQDAYYTRGGDYFENRRFPRSVTWFLGPFPENDIARDGERLNEVYTDAMYQQTSLDPDVRTVDLENPFNTSLLTMPPVEETVYSAPPAPPVIVLPPEARPAPPVAPAPERAVPALW